MKSLLAPTMAALILASTTGRCPASHITLKITPSVRFSRGRVGVSLVIANHGDEPAVAVSAEAQIGDVSATGPDRATIQPGEETRTSFDVGPAPTPPGAYTTVFRVRYADQNGHRFTALRSLPLLTAAPDDATDPVNARLSPLTVRHRGTLELAIRSRSSERLPVAATLVLPDELSCAEPVTNLMLEAGGETTCSFAIVNSSALPGSAYHVFAVVDCIIAGQHRTATGTGRVRIAPDMTTFRLRILGSLAALALLGLFVAAQFRAPTTAPRDPPRASVRPEFVDACFLVLLLAFLCWHVPLHLLLTDTTTVGGDTPAHNYLAGHIKEQLLSHGRIAAWSGDWWCGFPAFQFYFCLPYLLIAALDFVLPFNVAFKLVTVLGIFAVPPAAYLAARVMKLPRPGPILAAICTLPLLFDASHRMWGVNIYSTLAGMFANSLSFAVMLVALASVSRDLDDCRPRVRTVLLLAAMISSHFFTSVIAGLASIALLLKGPRCSSLRRMRVLVTDFALTALIMGWWLVPLIAKQEYTVDFGRNWKVHLWRDLPPFVPWLLPAVGAGVVIGLRRASTFVVLHLGMLLWALFLFFFGTTHVAAVFTNVRFWPFIVYSLLALAAAGICFLTTRLRSLPLLVGAAMSLALTCGIGTPNDVRAWARWNYQGLEAKGTADVLRQLVRPLAGTPGRLANDLHPANRSLGSTRIFEIVPYLVDKPILEGGIVNSAAGSMFSYLIQSETSETCAGYPNIVKPAGFDFAGATRHLELFNVKHFIARDARTRSAIEGMREWRHLRTCRDWALYELTSHEGRYVCVPERKPLAVRTARWKQAGLDWMYTQGALDTSFAILAAGDADDPFDRVLSSEDYSRFLAAARKGQPRYLAPPLTVPRPAVLEESVADMRISFRTSAPGAPHIVKCTYFPNWRSRGGEKVYMVTPCFMLVYPRTHEVELYYGYTLADNVGRGVTALGCVLLGVVWFAAGRREPAGSGSMQDV